MHPDSAKLFHKAFITDRLKSTQELLPLRNALWRWVGRAFRQPLESASAAIQVQVLRCEKLRSVRKAPDRKLRAYAVLYINC